MMKNEKIERIEEDIVARVLEADGLDAQQALAVLLRTLLLEFIKARAAAGGAIVMGKPTALELLMHALGTQRERNIEMEQQASAPGAGDPSAGEAAPSPEPVPGGIADVQGSLHEMAFECLRIGEEAVDKELAPKMRIVE